MILKLKHLNNCVGEIFLLVDSVYGVTGREEFPDRKSYSFLIIRINYFSRIRIRVVSFRCLRPVASLSAGGGVRLAIYTRGLEIYGGFANRSGVV